MSVGTGVIVRAADDGFVTVLRGSVHFELVGDARGIAQEAFGVDGIPHMAIIGRDGRILKVYRGYSEKSLDAIVADINKALAPLP